MRPTLLLIVTLLSLDLTRVTGQELLTNQLTNKTPQIVQLPSWDFGLTAGLFQANPKQGDGPFDDDWYFQGRYGVSIGRYWGSHFKTEVEFATTGEGARYTQRYASISGVPAYYPISVQERYQLNQLSGRVAWQFFENRWVHPYVFGGVALEAERRWVWVPEQFYYQPASDPRGAPNRIALSPSVDSGPDTNYRAGAIAGLGTKIYVSRQAYFNTSLLMAQARSSRNVSFNAGFGWDF